MGRTALAGVVERTGKTGVPWECLEEKVPIYKRDPFRKSILLLFFLRLEDLFASKTD